MLYYMVFSRYFRNVAAQKREETYICKWGGESVFIKALENVSHDRRTCVEFIMPMEILLVTTSKLKVVVVVFKKANPPCNLPFTKASQGFKLEQRQHKSMKELRSARKSKVIPANKNVQTQSVCSAYCNYAVHPLPKLPKSKRGKTSNRPASPTDSRFNKDYIMEKLCHVA